METKAEEQEIEIPRFDHIECQTRTELIKEMNAKAEAGYLPIWPSHNPILLEDSYFMILEYHEPIDTEERSEIKAKLSQKIMEAEFYATTASNDLKERTDDLRLTTNWDEVNTYRETQDKPPITNKEGREAYINEQTKKMVEWAGTTKRWLAHVKRLEKLAVLPDKAPWEEVEDPEPEKSDLPNGPYEKSGTLYCGFNTGKECIKCLECENGE